MGEAKRRKQSDPTYGKVPLLRTEKDRRENFNKVVDDLFSEFSLEIKTPFSFDKVPDQEYLRIYADLDRWVKNRLSNYRERDRMITANSLVLLIYEMHEKHDINPLLYKCLVNILESYTSSKFHEKLSE